MNACGLDYFRSGAVFDARRQGMTLKARCAGELAGVVYDCVAGGHGLAGEQEDAATRETVLEALFAAYRFDLESRRHWAGGRGAWPHPGARHRGRAANCCWLDSGCAAPGHGIDRWLAGGRMAVSY